MTQPDKLTIEDVKKLQSNWHDKSIGEQNDLWNFVSNKLSDTMRENERLRSFLLYLRGTEPIREYGIEGEIDEALSTIQTP